ncbi:MAG TPA: alpha/beta hydrolase fold domain-containing protein [Acidimicrobiales bacterium]|nr:alpha/beta hydrolase fold domain-containing protein [Acidimicrobiales bacterium]
MGRRPGVARSTWPIATTDLVGLAGQLTVALGRVPFRKPWTGEGNVPHNLAVSVTRETIRSFMGYLTSLPIDEFRSVELVLDDLSGAVLTPVVRSLDVDQQADQVAGVPGIWYRPRGTEATGTVLYLHGGGYVGTSPRMYAAFAAWLCRRTGCELFVADLRLAPEFPFPAGLEDAVLVLEGLLAGGTDPARLFVAGDSSGGGLATSLMYTMQRTHHARIGGVLLFSPELDLLLDEPSVAANADQDILPWNIPTAAYLHGRDPGDASVSAVDQDVGSWPPTLVAYGADEMFRDPIREFVGHLDAAVVDTVALEEPGMFHVFPILMPWAEASHRVFRAVSGFVADRLSVAEADAGIGPAAPPRAG